MLMWRSNEINAFELEDVIRHVFLSFEGLQLRLHATLAAAGRLPEELARGLGRSSAGPVGPSELCWALGAFAFAELFFSFHTAQEAIDEACQSFGAQLSSGAEPEDLLCAAEQLVKQKAGPQGLSSLYVFSAPFTLCHQNIS